MTADPIKTASKNNIWTFYSDPQAPIAKYMKRDLGAITGWRLNPNDNTKIDFLLKTDPADYNIGPCDPDAASYWSFRYNNDVVEIYNEAELSLFTALNKSLIDTGKLVLYDGRTDGTLIAFYPHVGHTQDTHGIGTVKYERKSTAL